MAQLQSSLDPRSETFQENARFYGQLVEELRARQAKRQ